MSVYKKRLKFENMQKNCFFFFSNKYSIILILKNAECFTRIMNVWRMRFGDFTRKRTLIDKENIGIERIDVSLETINFVRN